ncbi:MAG TPA: cupredoxin domain-containing protein [Candidatus Acidoferrales bacterium]|nr:cupredoxin domain-containing protein [Candidatus Acidoferrales bacterium]
MSRKRFYLCSLALLALEICAVLAPASRVVRAQDSGMQVIEMTAKKYEFSPVRVKAGTKVQLKVTATDRDHGIAIDAVADGAAKDSAPGLIIDSPEKCWKLPKGEPVTINFTAQTAGTYQIKCCLHCGLGHGGMKGTIVVE